MWFRRKRSILQSLQASFGRIKTEGFNFELIQRYRAHKEHSGAFQCVTDQTCADLDFELFFCYVDRTSSRIGQQMLYERLRTLDPKDGKFEWQERFIGFLKAHPEERLKLQYQLNKLNHPQAYYLADLFQKPQEPKSKWYALFPILSFAALLSLVLSFFQPAYIFILLALLPLHVVIHYGLKRKTYLFLNAVPSLLAMGAVAQKLFKIPLIKTHYAEVQSSVHTITSIRRKMSIFKLEQKVDSDMEAAYWFMLELIKITFLLEPLLLFSAKDKLRDKAKDIERVFECIGEVDCILSVCALRQGVTYCIPEISISKSKLQFTDLRHPLIPDCVPNPLEASRAVLLTGSNMSGKTTYIRAIGLNYLCGMALHTCFAETAHLPVARLYSVIRIEDDVMQSSSYFYKEMDEIKKIIAEAGTGIPSLILLDELFKGTNTLERIAAAKAVLSYLAKQDCHIFAATHDLELTTLLAGEFDLYHFSESIQHDAIHFDYRLKEGVQVRGNAIRILELHGFPKEIVDEAFMHSK
jgi:hypothetical protein